MANKRISFQWAGFGPPYEVFFFSHKYSLLFMWYEIQPYTFKMYLVPFRKYYSVSVGFTFL